MGYELDQGPRLISQGGNIYAAYLLPVKEGFATRGRGFWAGKKRQDEDNPDVDNPSDQPAQTLIARDADSGEDDGFDDEKNPLLTIFPRSDTTAVERIARKQQKELANAIYGGTTRKSVLALEGVKMDLLLRRPEEMTAEQLVKGAAEVQRIAQQQGLLPYERHAINNYAERVARALKSILTKPSEEREKEDAPKKAKENPKKATETKADENGKKQYKYPRDKDAARKNPKRAAKRAAKKAAKDSEGQAPEPAPEGDEQHPADDEPTVTKPEQLDPAHFAKLVNMDVEHLQQLTRKKSRDEFRKFWLGNKRLCEKYNLNELFFGRLYDALTQPEGGAQEGGGSTMGKSLVVIRPQKAKLIDPELRELLKAASVKTLGDMRDALSKSVGDRGATLLLRKWEGQGILRIRRTRRKRR